MKVTLVVTDLATTRGGGISKVATELGRGLVAAGHGVTVWLLGRRGLPRVDELDGMRLRYVEPFATPNADYPVIGFSRRAFAALSAADEPACDVVHAFNLNAFALPRYKATLRARGTLSAVSSFETIMMDVRAKAAEFRTLPSVATGAQVVFEFALATLCEKRYLAAADVLFTEDANTAGALEDMGLDRERVRLIPSGVDVEGAARSVAPAGVLDGRAGPLIGYVGRVDPRKGVQYLVQAMVEVRRRHPGAQLVLAGGSRHGYERGMRELIARLGLTDCVHLLGRVEGDILPYYKLFDVVAIPSLSEGIPITLGEAMASGVPVVITRLPGVLPFVKPADLVHWAEPGDASSLCAALDEALRDPARDDRVRRARAFIEAHSWSAVARRHAAAYEAARAERAR